MKRTRKQDVPKTIGELRRWLAQLGNPWEVDPQLGDDEPLPNPTRGGQSEAEIPEQDRPVPLAPHADIVQVIAAEPPANPFLRLRWADLGILSREDVDGLLPKASDEEPI